MTDHRISIRLPEPLWQRVQDYRARLQQLHNLRLSSRSAVAVLLASATKVPKDFPAMQRDREKAGKSTIQFQMICRPEDMAFINSYREEVKASGRRALSINNAIIELLISMLK